MKRRNLNTSAMNNQIKASNGDNNDDQQMIDEDSGELDNN